MKKTIETAVKKGKKAIALGGIASMGLPFIGCAGLATALYEDTPFGEIDMARQRARAPQVNVYGNQGNSQQQENNQQKDNKNTVYLTPRVYRGIADRINKAKEEELSIALWIDVNQNGGVDGDDLFSEQIMFKGNDKIHIIRKTPAGRKTLLRIVDTNNKEISFPEWVEEPDNLSGGDDNAVYKLGLIEIDKHLKPVYSNPSGIKRYEIKLIELTSNEELPYFTKEIYVDYDK